MAIDLNAKHKSTAFDRAAVRTWERWHKLHKKLYTYTAKGEVIFGDLLRMAEKTSNPSDIEQAYSALVGFYRAVAYDGKADLLLRKWIDRFPQSNKARLHAADYLWYTRWQNRKALAQLRKVKLPKTPSDDEVETYYLALELKGQLLLVDKKFDAAARQMRALADFTDTHFERLHFFFELRFVSEMVRSKLALQDCRRYLKTLSRREQVAHDQSATKKLLREINRALKTK